MPSRYEGAPIPCPHCPNGHQRPDWGGWAAWVDEQHLADNQPHTIIVARPNGSHVAEADAQWMRDLLNGRTGPSPLRVRNAILRQTHEAIRTRFGILVPVCGSQLRDPVEAEAGCEVTCPMCNGAIKPCGEETADAQA